MKVKWLGKVMYVSACLTAIVLLGGCSAFQRNSDTFAGSGGRSLSEGKAHLLSGDTVSARDELKQASKRGRSAEAYYYLALIERESDPEAALGHVRRSLNLYPTAQACLLEGALLEAKGDPARAVRSYEKGLEKAASGGEIAVMLHRNLAALLARQERWDDAHGHMERYVELSDGRGERLSDGDRALWGLCLYRFGERAKAQEVWNGVRDAGLRRRITEAASATDVSFNVE